MAGQKDDVKVLGTWASPFVRRVVIALNLKGLQYQFIEEDLLNKSELLLSLNPVYKSVPVLIHNDKPVCESLVILEYIDETWPDTHKLLPSDPYTQARCRFWATFIDNSLGKATAGSYRTVGEEREKAKAELERCVGILEKALANEFEGRPFFGGEKIGYVDVALGARAVWFDVIEEFSGVKVFDENTTPRLCEWYRCFCLSEAVSKALPPLEKLRQYAYNKYHPTSKSSDST